MNRQKIGVLSSIRINRIFEFYDFDQIQKQSLLTMHSNKNNKDRGFQYVVLSFVKKMNPQYQTRTATAEEVQMMVGQWETDQGWAPCQTDPELFRLTDPNGFFVGTLDGKPIVSICGIKCPRNFGFIGIYICKKEYRGKGYGLKLFKHCMEYLKGYNVSLEGVLAQEANYVKSGFKTHSLSTCAWFPGEHAQEVDPRIKSLKGFDFCQIHQYWLSRSTGYNEEFSRQWINHDKHHSFGFFEDGKIAGFGGMRKGQVYHKIGPLIAETPEIARKLISHFRNLAGPDAKISLNFVLKNEESAKIREELQAVQIYASARMFTDGEAKEIDYPKNFGITSGEIG